MNEKRAAPGKKRAATRKKDRNKERRDTMATSDESKSAEQGSGSGDISSEVTREAQVAVAGAAPPPRNTAAAAGGASAEGASPEPKAAPGSGIDAVRSAIMAMSDLKQDLEAIAVSAELSVQSATATSGQTDTDMAKLFGARAE